MVLNVTLHSFCKTQMSNPFPPRLPLGNQRNPGPMLPWMLLGNQRMKRLVLGVGFQVMM
jgi:hypothetical protein